MVGCPLDVDAGENLQRGLKSAFVQYQMRAASDLSTLS
jgi:hypothetical protein